MPVVSLGRVKRRVGTVGSILSALLIASCGSNDRAITGNDSEDPVAKGIACHEGFCNGDTDPFPNEPGIWISSTVTSETCALGGANDTDQDGLRDICETNLASYFAPQLMYKTTDNIEGEPRWAARYYWYAGEFRVVLLYLPSYYVDLGSTNPLCSVLQGACDGHAGDSEAIAIEVYYNEATQHWVVHRAAYSVHTGYNEWVRGAYQYPIGISYEGKVGGRPRAYVAFHKHANYASITQCNGGQYGFDNCDPNASRILATGANRNLGSNTVKQINCVTTSNPLYSSLGRQECYWNNMRFSGWIGSIPDSSPHRDRLVDFGFI